MQTNLDKPWMCWRCGYTMDCNSPAKGKPRTPKEGDISLCLSCGAFYTRHGSSWQAMTASERAELSEAEVRFLNDAHWTLRTLSNPDLSKRGGHT